MSPRELARALLTHRHSDTIPTAQWSAAAVAAVVRTSKRTTRLMVSLWRPHVGWGIRQASEVDQ
jgi:hypothetical protein